MSNYDMRIINRAPINKNGCFPFSEASINNIPSIDVFADSEINKLITDACKEVLSLSMNKANPFRYGE